MVFEARVLRGDEVRQRVVGTARRFLLLLAHKVEAGEHLLARLVRIDLYGVVFQGVRGEEAEEGARRQPLLGHDTIQKLLRVGEELAGFLALLGVVEYLRVATLQLPGVEKGRPVYIRSDLLQRVAVESAHAEHVRFRRRVAVPDRKSTRLN